MDDTVTSLRRRTILWSIGAGTSAIALAGCLGDDSADDPEDNGDEDETDGQYSVEGAVLGGGQTLEGAVVTLDERERETDEDGQFAFDGLEEGTYTVTAEAEGFESQEQEVSLPDEGGADLKLISFELTPE